MLIDTHVHTNRYSGCSSLDPLDLVLRAEEMNLDGFVITEHSYVWTKQEVDTLKKETGTELLILMGQEVTSYEGHILVYGVHDEFGYISAEELLQQVHDKGGVAFPAHPFRYGDFTMKSFEKLEKQLSGYDGFEVLNGNQNDEQNSFGQKAWEVTSITGIGGSDAHSLGMVGRFATEFKDEITDQASLINEIKAGRCKPVVLADLD